MAIVTSALGLLGIAVPGFSFDAIDKAAGVLVGNAGKRAWTEVRAKLQAYVGNVPTNHDLAKAIRLSELASTLVVVEAYRERFQAEAVNSRAAVEHSFFPAAKRWLLEQIGLTPSLEVVPNDELVSMIDNQIDGALASGVGEMIGKNLMSAETEVWTNLVAGVGQGEPPDEFKLAFFGKTDASPGWAVTFLAFAREALKSEPRVEVAFVTSRLAALRSLARTIETRLESMAAELGEQGKLLRDVVKRGMPLNREQVQVFAEVLAIQQNEVLSGALMARVEALNMDIGAIRETIRNFLDSIGHPPVSLTEMGAAFRGVAEKYLFLQELQGKEGVVDAGKISAEALLYEKVVILMQGKNPHGDAVYCYLQLTLDSLYRLKQASFSREDFLPNHFGFVIASGSGQPSKALMAEMRERYNMYDTPSPSVITLKEPVSEPVSRDPDEPQAPSAFNPGDYIQVLEDGYVHCTNPVNDGGLSGLTVNLRADESRKQHLENSLVRMVLDETMHPKFAKVILMANRMEERSSSTE